MSKTDMISLCNYITIYYYLFIFFIYLNCVKCVILSTDHTSFAVYF